MIHLPITLTTASILGLMFVWLSARVIAGRVQNEVLIGDAGQSEMLYRIRTHGNFTEYVPVFLILLTLLELSGANATVLVVLAALFVIARLLHVPGMGPDANLKLRQAGIVGSFTAIVAASVYGVIMVLL